MGGSSSQKGSHLKYGQYVLDDVIYEDSLLSVYGDNAMLLRRNDWYDSRLRDRLNNFTSSHETPAGPSVGIIALKD